MTLTLRLDPDAAQVPGKLTVYIATDCPTVHLRDGAGSLNAYRLDRVVTHDGTWTAWLIRQTDRGRDYARGGTVPTEPDRLPAPVRGDITAALAAADTQSWVNRLFAPPPPEEAAARTLGELAGWTTPPDVGDPAVLRLAYEAARGRLAAAAAALNIGPEDQS
jgi:hypothetical protein